MDIRAVELLFLLLLLFIIAFGQLARRIGTPYPIVMIIGGLLLGFIPGIPRITLDPDLIFLVVLPPLLYASAWTTSWRDFRLNLVSILFLAFGLVIFTVLGVAFVGPHVLRGFDWRLALVLGAIVVSRTVPTIQQGLLELTWLTVGGIALGLILGWLVYLLEKRVDDGPIEIALSILTPYAAYFIADAAHASGVLAVVACGLFLTRKSASMFSPQVRIQVWSFWQSFTFVLNGLVFVLIGLQLPWILASIHGYSHAQMFMDGALFSLVLIVLRLAWVFPGSWLANFVSCRIHHTRRNLPAAREVFVVGWTGMRGVVSLAAALALPEVLADGKPFPQRDFLVFLTFCVILVTLVLQGVTLAPLVRLLGLENSGGEDCEEQDARRIVLEAAIEHLETIKVERDEVSDEIFDDLIGHYRHKIASLSPAEADQEHVAHHYSFQEISRETTRVERETAVRLRNEGRINDQVLRRIERELDLNESRYAAEDGD